MSVGEQFVRELNEHRFWSKVLFGLECWEWNGGYFSNGYGRFCFPRSVGKRRTQRAHRVAWAFTFGKWPDNLVLHKCDNPKCVKPSHLFLGTHRDNMVDKGLKGRNWFSNLTHCRQGHLLIEPNLYRDSSYPSRRICKICKRASVARYQSKRA